MKHLSQNCLDKVLNRISNRLCFPDSGQEMFTEQIQTEGEEQQQDPGRTERLFRSLQNVTASHLADPKLFDFESLAAADD